MKPKLVDIIQVCVVTALVVAPTLVMGGIIWQKHLDFVALSATQGAIATPTLSNPVALSSAKTSCLLSSTAQSLSLYPVTTQLQMVIGGICIGLCVQWVGKYVGRKLSRLYHLYRAAVLKEQVKTLERLWHEGMQS